MYISASFGATLFEILQDEVTFQQNCRPCCKINCLWLTIHHSLVQSTSEDMPGSDRPVP